MPKFTFHLFCFSDCCMDVLMLLSVCDQPQQPHVLQPQLCVNYECQYSVVRALVGMNRNQNAKSSPAVASCTDLMANARGPASGEAMQMTDRSTIYRNHDYEELPTSRFACFEFHIRFYGTYFNDVFLQHINTNKINDISDLVENHTTSFKMCSLFPSVMPDYQLVPTATFLRSL